MSAEGNRLHDTSPCEGLRFKQELLVALLGAFGVTKIGS